MNSEVEVKRSENVIKTRFLKSFYLQPVLIMLFS